MRATLPKSFGVGCMVLGLWLVPTLLTFWSAGNWQLAGVVGDTFGVPSALFSGLALLGVVYTIRQQQQSFEDSARQANEERKAAREQILQLALSTQLQTARALLSDYRRALIDLHPAIGNVPTATTMLKELRSQIERDARVQLIPAIRATDIIENIDEVLALQQEISRIREVLLTRQSGA